MLSDRDEYGKVYRVYLVPKPSCDKIEENTILSDERIIIFSNGLVYCYQRVAKARQLFLNLESYIKTRAQQDDTFNGICYCDYREPVGEYDLLFSLCDTYDGYSAEEVFTLIESINKLFNENVQGELS